MSNDTYTLEGRALPENATLGGDPPLVGLCVVCGRQCSATDETKAPAGTPGADVFNGMIDGKHEVYLCCHRCRWPSGAWTCPQDEVYVVGNTCFACGKTMQQLTEV